MDFKYFKVGADFNLQYKELAKVLHPDRGGDAEKFVEMKAEYDLLDAEIKAGRLTADLRVVPENAPIQWDEPVLYRKDPSYAELYSVTRKCCKTACDKLNLQYSEDIRYKIAEDFGFVVVTLPSTYTPWEAVQIERILRAEGRRESIRIPISGIQYKYKRKQPHIIYSDFTTKVTIIDYNLPASNSCTLQFSGFEDPDIMKIAECVRQKRVMVPLGDYVVIPMANATSTDICIANSRYQNGLDPRMFAGWR